MSVRINSVEIKRLPWPTSCDSLIDYIYLQCRAVVP